MNGRNRSRRTQRQTTTERQQIVSVGRHVNRYDRQRVRRNWQPLPMLCAAHGRYISRGVVAGCW